MCQAFSCIVTKKGKVLWELGIDSHDELLLKHKIKDDTAVADKMKFARCEITPDNKDYLYPDNAIIYGKQILIYNKKIIAVSFLI